MSELIDLHTHSTESDGSMEPEELVRHAKKCGLSAIALTDHDTIGGVDRALNEGKAVGLEVIPGIEISVDFKPEMHVLGYFFNGAHKNIKGTLANLKEGRERRNLKIIGKLNELGFDISLEEVKEVAWGGIVGRPHIARVLMEKGYVKSINEAFERLLASSGAAYFRREELTPEEGIREITKAGGIPVLAHPIYLELEMKKLDTLLSRLVSAGLRGIEAYYVENTDNDTGNLLRLALKHNLLATGGSDFHGSFKPHIEIGKGRGNLKVPYELLERLKAAGQI